jgi:2-keto-4-pentenoate hydratase
MALDVDTIVRRLWDDIQRGDHFPQWLAGTLDLDTALAVQVGLLAEQERTGERLSGWKVGLTSERARGASGSDTRPFGYLLASHTFPSGSTIEAGAIRHGTVEPEFLFTVGERLSGPDLDPHQVRDAVARVAAGFELNERRPGSARPDLAMLAADRMTQWGIVEGEGIDPGSIEGSLDDVRVRLVCDGEERLSVRGGDEVDDHWSSIARLVSGLHRHGLALEPGQKVITGGLARFDLAPGERWRAEYEGIGAVEVLVR